MGTKVVLSCPWFVPRASQGFIVKLLEKTIRLCSYNLCWAARVVLVGIVVLISVSVFLRYGFNKPIAGDVDMVELMMVALVALGLAYTQAEEGHVSVKLLVDRLPLRLQTGIDIFVFLMATGILCLIVWQSFGEGVYSFLSGEHSMTIGIPFFYFKFLIPLGFFIWALETLLKVLRSVIILRKGARS